MKLILLLVLFCIYAFPQDTIKPAAINDLSLSEQGSNDITISWTSPFDSSKIVEYDIRFSTSDIIDDSSFNYSKQILLTGLNDIPNLYKSIRIDSLNYYTEYYIVIKSKDEFGNVSEFSNVLFTHTLSRPIITVQPNNFAFWVSKDTVITDTLKISNFSCNASVLDYSIESTNEVLDFGRSRGRLNNGFTDEIIFTLNTSLLHPGMYLFNVDIKSNDSANYVIPMSIMLNLKNPVILEDEENIIHSFSLEQNYPNPFNPETIINFALDKDDYMELKIFDAVGNEVDNLLSGYTNKGSYQFLYSSKLPSGVYFYQLKSSTNISTKKMTILK